MICHKDTRTQSLHKGPDFAALANWFLRPLREMDFKQRQYSLQNMFCDPNLKSTIVKSKIILLHHSIFSLFKNDATPRLKSSLSRARAFISAAKERDSSKDIEYSFVVICFVNIIAWEEFVRINLLAKSITCFSKTSG